MLGSVAEMVADIPQTFLTDASAATFSHTMELAVDSIDSDPDQARKLFSEAEIQSLAATIATEGQLQPILVRKNPDIRLRWIIVAGERRWRAVKLLGWHRILGVEHAGDSEVASLLENLQRVDLTLVEEAYGLKRLQHARGWTQGQVAESLGRSLSDVNGALKVLELPPEFLDKCLSSDISVSRNALIELARVEPGAIRDRLLAQASAGTLTTTLIRAAKSSVSASKVSQKRAAAYSDVDGGGTTAPVSLKIVGKLRDAIRDSSKARRVLGSGEREELQQLAQEITQLLSLSDQSFT